MKYLISSFGLVLILLTNLAFGADPECIPPPGGKCLNADQFNEVKKAIEELDQIHKAPAIITTQDPIVIIQDWQGRVYVNGGETQPLKLKLKLGTTIDRDLSLVLPTQIYYRPKPTEPFFRLRIRAQFGILAPELVRTAYGNKQSFLDAGIGWDFFHVNSVNFSVYTGLRSIGGGIGLDLTKNFGPYLGYSLVYDGWRSSLLAGCYFSFN